VSKEQPEAQPVAAGPVKVGETLPRLLDLTVLVVLTVPVVVATRADAVPPEAMTSATGSDNSDSRVKDFRAILDIEPHHYGRCGPREVRAPDAPAPAPGVLVRSAIVPAPDCRRESLSWPVETAQLLTA
jgi:hypothetical protein